MLGTVTFDTAATCGVAPFGEVLYRRLALSGRVWSSLAATVCFVLQRLVGPPRDVSSRSGFARAAPSGVERSCRAVYCRHAGVRFCAGLPPRIVASGTARPPRLCAVARRNAALRCHVAPDPVEHCHAAWRDAVTRSYAMPPCAERLGQAGNSRRAKSCTAMLSRPMIRSVQRSLVVPPRSGWLGRHIPSGGASGCSVLPPCGVGARCYPREFRRHAALYPCDVQDRRSAMSCADKPPCLIMPPSENRVWRGAV